MGINYSRRKVLLGGGAALIAASVVKADQGSGAGSYDLRAANREVSVLTRADGAFGIALDPLYPGLQKQAAFQAIAPLAVLITLRSGPSIRAYSVTWSATTAAGLYTTTLFYYHAPGSQAKHRSVSTLGSARQDILQPGDSVLVTPFFNWTPNFYQNNPRPDWKTLVSGVEPGDFLVSELPTATEVKVSVDGVLFSDWKSIGPDKHHLGRRVKLRRNAEHDEGLAVYRKLKAGASDSEVSAMLTAHASAQRSSASIPPQRVYEQARRFHAQVLLRHFQDADRDTFNKALHRLVKQRKIPLIRATA